MTEKRLIEKYNVIEDENEKIEFLESIAELHDPEALEVFKEAMGDSRWRIRKTAIEGLLRYYDLSAVIELLLQLVHEEENANLRNSAIEGLVRLGSKATYKIIEALPRENDEIKKFYVDILGEIGDESVAPYLIRLLDTEDENLLSAVIEVLGKIGNAETIKILIDILEKRKDNINIVFCVLSASRDILSRYPKIQLEYRNFLPYIDEPLLRKAFLELAGYISDPKIILPIVENLNIPQKGIREAAFRAIYKFYIHNPQYRKELLDAIRKNEIKKDLVYKALNSSNIETKSGAALVLAARRDTSAIPQILRSIEENREFFLEIMEFYGEEVVGIIHDICFDFDDDTKSFMCKIISKMGNQKSEDLLLDLIQGGSEKLVASVAEALARVGTEKSIEPLVRYLTKGENVETVEAVINALKRLVRDYPSVASQVIEKYLDSCTGKTCKKNMLWLIGDTESTQYWKYVTMLLKDNDPEIRKWALRTLRQLKVKDSLFQVQPLCFDEDEKVRIEAIKALAAIGGREVLDYFKILKEDPNFWIRLETLKALEEILGDEVVEYLVDKMDDPIGAVVVVALEILDRHWSEKYKNLLKNALKHPDPEVIHTAMEIAIKRKVFDIILEAYKELPPESRKKIINSLYRIPLDPDSAELIKKMIKIETDSEIKNALVGLANAR